MTVYVVVVENEIGGFSKDPYVKVVVDSEEKAKEKVNELIKLFASHYGFTLGDIKSYQELRSISQNGKSCTVWYEAFNVM